MLLLLEKLAMDLISNFLNSLLNTDGSSQSDTMSGLQMLGALGIAYLGGILSSLTPCVYPMIPITVSVVGGLGSARERTWRDVLFRGLAYVGGMTLIYSVLGVLAGLTGKVFGTLTNNSGWYLGLGIVLTLASLVMMDVIPFDPATGWESLKRRWRGPSSRTVIHHHEKEMTALGAFALGASSGFIAAPCTTPVLTAILSYIAKTQSVVLGLFLMIFFSIGLGTLLLLIATFAGALRVLPKSGQWLKTMKTGSGLLLLAFAIYLVYRAGEL
jgi:thiol:disulfide interchange protein DsbD